MYIFVMALLMQIDPPIFAFLGDHDTIEECQQAIEKLDVPDKSALGCMVLVKPGSVSASVMDNTFN
jgi:hypothetical protein